jgi:hypothetical protein
VEPTRLQREGKANEQLAEKHISTGWERNRRELRPIAGDRKKWNELVDICSSWNDGHIYY